ncbi:MAG: nitrogenase component 1 [Deltaproteobacteria bacterium]|nr:nitrogenase component 1 [Deltaproteobacteria bacterium]
MDNTDYYEQTAPPVRDHRLNAGDSFAASRCGALLAGAREGLLPRTCRDFWQGNACQMSLSLLMAATVENAAIVLHGPVGCGSTLHNLGPAVRKGKAARGLAPTPANWLSTNLLESDIIGGGERKLTEAILHADRTFNPEIIFVVSTCAPSVIGDDTDEIVQRVNAQTKASVVLLDCPGFKSRVVASAYDAFYHGLIRFLPLDPPPADDRRAEGPQANKIIQAAKGPKVSKVTKGSRKSVRPSALNNANNDVPNNDATNNEAPNNESDDKARTINVFNATSIGPADEVETERLLAAMGFKTRVYAEYSNAEKFRYLTQAVLNVSLCDVHDDYMFCYLKAKRGMPYVMGGMPMGLGGTRRWLGLIGEALGLAKEAANLADAEEERLRPFLSPILPALKGKRVLAIGGVSRVMAVSVTLKELGLTPVGFHAYHYDDSATPFLEVTERELPDLPAVVSSQDYELFGAVKKYGPDLVISHAGTQGLMAKMGVPAMQLFDVDRPHFGYRGLYAFAKRMAFAFENTSYQKRLASKVRFPYKGDWFKGDPYGHIKTT